MFLPIMNLFSQTDSLKKLLDYYPLHIGNYWEYSYSSKTKDPKDTIPKLRYKEIVGDTVISNNKYYLMVESNLISVIRRVQPICIRIDSVTGNVYQYDHREFKDYKVENLFTRIGEEIIPCINYVTDYEKELFNKKVIVKKRETICISSNDEYGWELAEGLGEIRRKHVDVFSYGWYENNDLIYAKINGVEYGTRTKVEESEQLPIHFNLFQNYPNPFNPITIIKYSLLERALVSLKIYDALGREISILVTEEKNPGYHQVEFKGDHLSSGIYYYSLRAGKNVQTKKLLLLK